MTGIDNEQIFISDTSKGQIEVRLSGRGIPLLFIHGGHVDCRETIFQKGLDPAKFLFISISRPGYGNTPLTDTNKTPRGTADLIVALLDELKISRVSLVGISAGGLTTLELAASYPHRIHKLLLLSALTKKWFNTSEITYRGAKWIFSPGIQRGTWSVYKGLFKIFPKATTQMMFRQLSSFRPIEFTHDEQMELKGMTLNMNSGKGFVNDLDQDIDQAILSKLHCPTLIIHSRYDNSVNISHAENARDNIKSPTLMVVDNRWGHLLWIGREYESILVEINSHLCS